MATVSVRAFGAIGDGVHLDTKAIQAAIDACAREGGGEVLFPIGTYLSGTVFLKDDVTLHLDPQAVLLGSKDVADYAAPAAGDPSDTMGGLVCAEGVRNVGISGAGAIDGQGKEFPHGMENYNFEAMENAEVKQSFVRPFLVRIKSCENVVIKDVSLRNAACFALYLNQCRQVRVNGVRINNRVNQNTDGMDLYNCEDVFISDCHMSCGDDAIAIYQSGQRIVVTNCVITSRWAAFRIGPFSTGTLKDITVSNCVVYDTYGAAIKLQMVEGGVMENISFSDLVLDHVTGPISLRRAGWLGWRHEREKSLPIGTLRNIRFHNIRATISDNAYPLAHEGPRNPGEARSCITITGLPGCPVEGITFSDVHITFPGGGSRAEAERRNIPEMPDEYPEYHMFGVLPAYGIYARHVRDVALQNVRFDLADPDLRPAILFEDAEGLEIAGFQAASDPSQPLIRAIDARDAFIHGCRPLSAGGTFLRVEGAQSSGITLSGNRIGSAGKAVELAERAAATAAQIVSS